MFLLNYKLAYKSTTTFLILFALLYGRKALAQGPGLLLQQYGKNAYDLEYFNKWNVALVLQPHLSKPSNRESKGKLQLQSRAEVHYRSTKTFGISSGVHYHRIRYQYAYPNDESLDRLTYVRVPLLLSVYPVKRLRTFSGGSYHYFLKGTGQPPPATAPVPYPEGTFVNSLGEWLVQTIVFGENSQQILATIFRRKTPIH